MARTLVSVFADRILAGMTMGSSTHATRLQSEPSLATWVMSAKAEARADFPT